MNVAFWSNSYNKCSVTNNMLAISLASALLLPYRILLFENYLSSDNIGSVFSSNKPVYLNEDIALYGGRISCVETLINDLNKCINNDIYISAIREILVDKLYYLSPNNMIHNDLFDYEMRMNIACFLGRANQYTNLQYIDTSPISSLSTKHILEISNLIIVNICPEVREINDFFLNYKSLSSKAIFIINVTNLSKCRTIYRFFKHHNISEKRVIFIPYNDKLAYANYYGSLIEFIMLNIHCCRESKDFLYFRAIRRIVKLIHNNLIDQEFIKESSELCF